MTKEDDAWFHVDEEASAIERSAGIPEPRHSARGFILSIFLPVILMGIFLLLFFWVIIFRFRLLG